jgi:hypothetical protein
MQKAWGIVFVLLSGPMGCGPAPVAVGPTHVVGWLDVSAGEKRYYGLYLYETAGRDGPVVAASGVLLMPWDDRPECGISIEGDGTEVKVQDQKQTFPGRPLLQLASSDAELKIVARDIDLSHYKSRRTLEKAVTGLLSATAERER